MTQSFMQRTTIITALFIISLTISPLQRHVSNHYLAKTFTKPDKFSKMCLLFVWQSVTLRCWTLFSSARTHTGRKTKSERRLYSFHLCFHSLFQSSSTAINCSQAVGACVQKKKKSKSCRRKLLMSGKHLILATRAFILAIILHCVFAVLGLRQ